MKLGCRHLGGADSRHQGVAGPPPRPVPAGRFTCVALTRKAALHAGECWPTTSHPRTYSNAVTSSSGQVDVVWVCRHAAISPGDIGSHIFTDAVDTLASAVRPCRTANKTMTRGKMSGSTVSDVHTCNSPSGGVGRAPVGSESHYSGLWGSGKPLHHLFRLHPPSLYPPSHPLIHSPICYLSIHPPAPPPICLPTHPVTHSSTQDLLRTD